MRSYFDLHAPMGRMGSSGRTEHDYWNYIVVFITDQTW
jgi:hypothetical protein